MELKEPIWRTKEGQEIKMSDMETSHIQNCIRMIERKWDELDHDDYLVADGDGLTGVVFVPGLEYYGEKLKELRRELTQRLSKTDSQTVAGKNAPTEQ